MQRCDSDPIAGESCTNDLEVEWCFWFNFPSLLTYCSWNPSTKCTGKCVAYHQNLIRFYTCQSHSGWAIEGSRCIQEYLDVFIARQLMLEPSGPDWGSSRDFRLPLRSLGPVLLAEEMVPTLEDWTLNLLLIVSAGL
jgi:hypothetical protein